MVDVERSILKVKVDRVANTSSRVAEPFSSGYFTKVRMETLLSRIMQVMRVKTDLHFYEPTET